MRVCRIAWMAWLLGFLCPLAGAQIPARQGDATILAAGNAETDADRLAALRRLRDVPGLDAKLARDVDAMMGVVAKWITSKRLDYFGRTVSRTRDFDFGIEKDSPLWPMARLYRGRMLTWVTLENGGIRRSEKLRGKYLGKAREDFEAAAKAFPDNRILGMYLGRPLPAGPRPQALSPGQGRPEGGRLTTPSGFRGRGANREFRSSGLAQSSPGSASPPARPRCRQAGPDRPSRPKQQNHNGTSRSRRYASRCG